MSETPKSLFPHPANKPDSSTNKESPEIAYSKVPDKPKQGLVQHLWSRFRQRARGLFNPMGTIIIDPPVTKMLIVDPVTLEKIKEVEIVRDRDVPSRRRQRPGLATQIETLEDR